jgi:hypothetical protein
MIRAGLSDLGLCIAVAACGASETISTSADAGGDASMIADASMNTDAGLCEMQGVCTSGQTCITRASFCVDPTQPAGSKGCGAAKLTFCGGDKGWQTADANCFCGESSASECGTGVHCAAGEFCRIDVNDADGSVPQYTCMALPSGCLSKPTCACVLLAEEPCFDHVYSCDETSFGVTMHCGI